MFIFFLILLVHVVFVENKLLCNVYQNKADNTMMYTIANYWFPRMESLQLIEENVLCPCNTTQICIRKCCFSEDIFRLSVKQCSREQDIFISNERRFDESILSISPLINYIIIHGSNCLSEAKTPGNFTFSKNGILLMQNYSLDIENYCLDHFEYKPELMMLQCQEINWSIKPIPNIYSIFYAISIIFLIITFGVYLFITILRNLLGKILLCYVFSLLITDTLYLILQLFLITEGIFCIISAFMIQFSFLASFFWLNVMCFDLWLTFSGHRSFNGSTKERDHKKFIFYCLYAWGCPAIITCITLITEFCPLIPDTFIKPDFGKSKCWFESKTALFWYFYSFISVILISNLWMFFKTTSIVLKHKKEAKVFKRSDSRCHNEHDHQKFYLYLKLFIVMGVNWLMEILSYYIEGPQYLWLITDAANTLQGVMIFLIFVCKKRILLLLNKKLYPKNIFFSNGLKYDNKNKFSRCSSLPLSTINSKNSFQVKVEALPSENNTLLSSLK